MSKQTLSFFGADTDRVLNEPLAKEHVKQRDAGRGQKLSYLPSHYVIDKANEIFGFGNWSTEIMHHHMLDKSEYEKPPFNAGESPKAMVAVAYMCQLKLTVRASGGSNEYEDVGFGNGVANAAPAGLHSAIELAIKESVTDALKRCMRYYGAQFGLSLYDKDETLLHLSEVEAARLVTDEQLKALRDLYAARDIDDDWVLAYLKAENYPNKTLGEMRNDWYQLAYKGAYEYRLDEIKASEYDEDIVRVLDLLKKATGMPMAKALFQEAWVKTKDADDKPRQLEAQQIYEDLKAKFETKAKTEDK